MAKSVKLFKLRGKVVEVYDPRQVNGRGGTCEVTDVNLKLENGVKVRVSFWDQDPGCESGNKVLITSVSFKGKYKNTPQYSSTSKTEVEVLGGKTSSDENEEENPAEPEVGEPEEESEGEPEGEEEEKPKKKSAKKQKVEKAEGVSEDAATLVQDLASKAVEITDEVCPEDIAKDPQAKQAFFATIFIALGKENYFDSQR